MQIYNTETGQVDNVSKPQALRVMQRTNGLWEEYSGQDLNVPKKRMRRTKAQIEEDRLRDIS